jgi:hypothetical protein
MRCTSTAVCSDKRPTRQPMDHFKRLLMEACPNHAYPVRHRLKDCGMMTTFMTSGSLTKGTKFNDGPDGSDTTTFPKENVVMMFYGGCPPSGRRRVSSLRPRTQVDVVGDTGAKGCNGTSFPSS